MLQPMVTLASTTRRVTATRRSSRNGCGRLDELGLSIRIANGVGEIPNKIETVSGAFGRVYTRRTDAVWIISSGVVQNETADGHLVRLPFDTDMTKGPVGLMTRPDTQPGAEEQVFRLAVQTVIEELGLSS